jgi:hypothetical protein
VRIVSSVTVRYLPGWLILAVVAVGNGVLRETTYGKFLPELASHQVSTLMAMVFTGIVVWMLHRRWPIASSRQAWLIGVLWLVFTIAFEFGFGHFIVGHSWARLLTDYNLFAGRVWPLFLLWVMVLPYVIRYLSNVTTRRK